MRLTGTYVIKKNFFSRYLDEGVLLVLLKNFIDPVYFMLAETRLSKSYPLFFWYFASSF